MRREQIQIIIGPGLEVCNMRNSEGAKSAAAPVVDAAEVG